MIEPTLKKNLLTLVAVYRKATGRTLGAVSYDIYGHALFLEDFRSGKRSVSLRVYDDMIEKLKRIWPDDLPRPTLTAVPCAF